MVGRTFLIDCDYKPMCFFFVPPAIQGSWDNYMKLKQYYYWTKTLTSSVELHPKSLMLTIYHRSPFLLTCYSLPLFSPSYLDRDLTKKCTRQGLVMKGLTTLSEARLVSQWSVTGTAFRREAWQAVPVTLHCEMSTKGEEEAWESLLWCYSEGCHHLGFSVKNMSLERFHMVCQGGGFHMVCQGVGCFAYGMPWGWLLVLSFEWAWDMSVSCLHC